MCAYNANIPQNNDRIKVSRAEILENFTQIKNVFDVDHETFDAPNGQGKHKQVTFPLQAVAPGAPAVGELRMYNATGTTGNPELFIRRNAGNPIEITSANLGAQGYSMTSSGLLIKWGSATIAGTGVGAQTFVWPAAATDIPFATQYYAIVQISADPGDVTKDVNAVAYVTSVGNPAQVAYRVWRRNLVNTSGTNQNPFGIYVLAIGEP